MVKLVSNLDYFITINFYKGNKLQVSIIGNCDPAPAKRA